MNNKIFILVLVALVSLVAAGGQDVTFCRSPQGVHCNYGGEGQEQRQEVVQTLNHEETAATTQDYGAWQQNTDINRKFDVCFLFLCTKMPCAYVLKTKKCNKQKITNVLSHFFFLHLQFFHYEKLQQLQHQH